ncbi:MAG TPA: MarR family winged helix-turn-helix transcriptional regulator [Acidimicrobiales bacterium]|nr:MarR family winged helix-turn-helix transcriptional regulator [Acidimicrobiales bacterium]
MPVATASPRSRRAPAAGPPTPGTDLSTELSRTLSRLHRTLRRRVNQAMAGDGLSDAMVDLLRLALVRPGLRVGEAAAELSLAPNSVSTMVSRLVEAGLLERGTAVGDRRGAALAISPAGRSLLAARRDSRRASLAAGLGALEPDDQAAVAQALPALARLVGALGGPRPDRRRDPAEPPSPTAASEGGRRP